MARDYYEILGVERTVDAAGLKSAYRKLAMQHHPDRNGGCEESMARFKEISEAYSVLSDDQKRAAYDRYGHAGVNGGAGGNPFGQGGAGACGHAEQNTRQRRGPCAQLLVHEAVFPVLGGRIPAHPTRRVPRFLVTEKG